MATIDDELLDRLTFTGTPQRCAARFADYEGLADEIVCLELGGAQDGGPTDRAGAGVRARPADLTTRGEPG